MNKVIKIEDITISKLKSGKLKKELPEFYELKKVIENNPWHNNESTFIHTLSVLVELNKFFRSNKNTKVKNYLNKKIDNYSRKELLFLATVLHDLGKKETIVKAGKVSSFPKHEAVSVLKAMVILKRFVLSKKEKDIIYGIIKKHSDLHNIMDEDNKNLKKDFSDLMKSSKNFSVELIIMVMMDTVASYLKKTMPQKYNFRVGFYKNSLISQ